MPKLEPIAANSCDLAATHAGFNVRWVIQRRAGASRRCLLLRATADIGCAGFMSTSPNSEFTQLAELLCEPHKDATNLAHDAIDPMHHTATLSAQHAHHFLV